MSPESALSEEQVAHCIQLCLSEDEVPDEELRTLNDLMKTNSDKAKDIAVRILDENMVILLHIAGHRKAKSDLCELLI